MELSSEARATLLDAARETIRRSLSRQPIVVPPVNDPALLQPAGCFVSLHTLHPRRLRGCVGRLEAAQPLLQAVVSGAVNVLRDPRFGSQPVTLAELPELEIELSILSPLQLVAGPLDFDPAVHGIYLTCAGRSGCFLPQVAHETGWGREQLLARLCTEKMGLPQDFWQQPGAQLQVFTTLLVGPEPFEKGHAPSSAAEKITAPPR